MSVRIYSLARGHDVPSKDVVDVCIQLGIEVKSHMSSISEEDAARVVEAIKNRERGQATPVAKDPGKASQAERALKREDFIPSGSNKKLVDLNNPEAEPSTRKPQKSKGKPRPTVQSLPATAVPPPSKTKTKPEPKPKETERVQKPQMRLSPEALKGVMKTKPADAAPAPAPQKQDSKPRVRPKPKTTPIPEPKPETKRSKKEKQPADDAANRPAAGAVAGREERQKRRDRRAKERRQVRDVDILSSPDDDRDTSQLRKRMRNRGSSRQTSTTRPTSVELESPATVRSLSQSTGIRVSDLIRKLMELNIMSNVNDVLDDDTAQMLSMEFGVEVGFKKEVDAEEKLIATIEGSEEEDPGVLSSRPPVVTFLGHVDHGKTSLLDAIRKTNVVVSESGGITQHIGAYQATHDGRSITFLDTPGHQAFTAMRARGANVTDIVVLIVAADDGVMPQTEEAISHAKAAGVPIVVAINKSDLPNANSQRVLQQISTHGLVPTEWGGEVECIETSATAGQGIDTLLETLALTAELHELKANADKPAVGTCLEAAMHGNRGVIATLLVREGTLRKDDIVVCGAAYGRIKAMYDENDQPLDEAPPSTPVSVSGFDDAPDAGEKFAVISDLSEARQIVDQRRDRQRNEQLTKRSHISLDNLFKKLEEEEVQELKLIIRADVRGSLEAIAKELEDFEHPEVTIRILQSSVGGITEGDVLLAGTSDAIIIGFRVVPDERARILAEEEGVEIRRYDVIYKLTEEIRQSLEGLLRPERKEIDLGRALVQQLFKLSRAGNIAGCRVLHGTIERNAKVRLIRDGRVIYPVPGSGKEVDIQSLKRVKDDVREVREGFECGIKIAGYDDIKEGDIIEAYQVEEVRRSL